MVFVGYLGLISPKFHSVLIGNCPSYSYYRIIPAEGSHHRNFFSHIGKAQKFLDTFSSHPLAKVG